MTNYELSEAAKKAMHEHDFDKAIQLVRRITETEVSIKMEILVIKYEQAVSRR